MDLDRGVSLSFVPLLSMATADKSPLCFFVLFTKLRMDSQTWLVGGTDSEP